MKTRKATLTKRTLSLLLSLALAFALLPAAAYADEPAASPESGEWSAKYLGTGNNTISGWDEAANAYNYVYYGEYNAAPVKWRVLDTKMNTGTPGLFLLSENLLDVLDADDDTNRHHIYLGGLYQNSAQQQWNNDFYDVAFSVAEQNSIAATTKSDAAYDLANTYSAYAGQHFGAVNNNLANDKVFFMSAEEAETAEYGLNVYTANPANGIAIYTNRQIYFSSVPDIPEFWWWLRSAWNESGMAPLAGVVDQNYAHTHATYPRAQLSGRDFAYAARPAFNLDPSGAIFISPATGGKTGAGFAAVQAGDAVTEYKLTLPDGAHAAFAAESSALNNGVLTVAYEGSVVGNNEYISAVIVDERGEITYYGALAQPSEADGTVDITLPEGFSLDGGGGTLYVFAEQKNDDLKTDYASAPIQLGVPEVLEDPEPEPEPEYSVGGAAAPTVALLLNSAARTVGFAGQEWYVIGYNGNGVYSQDGTATLLVKGAPYGNTVFNNSGGSTNYSGSVLQTALGQIAESFPTEESALINTRTLTSEDDISGSDAENQKLWPLSLDEVDDISANGVDAITIRSTGTAWWSTRTAWDSNTVFRVSNGGTKIAEGSITDATIAARPAFSLSLESVLFMSAAGDSSVSAGALAAAAEPSGAVKLTVVSDTQALTVTPPTGDSLDFTYSNATTGTNQYMSALLEQGGAVQYYGKLSVVGGDSSGSFTLPLDGVVDGTYTLKIFSEKVNSGNYTNFCSNPVSLYLTVSNGTGTVSGEPDEPEAPIVTISDPNIVGLTAPVAGEPAVTAITESAQFTGTVTWEPALPEDGRFAYNTAYKATITITPKQGYTLLGIPKNFFNVVAMTGETNAKDSGDVKLPKFAKTGLAAVSIADIPGVTPPVGGAKAGAKTTATSQYTGTVTWSPEPVEGKFAYNQAYTATITLTPKTGFGLTGVAKDFFTVAGAAKTTNAKGSGIVTAMFAKTGKTPIDISQIDGIAAPVGGAKPVAKITATAQYSGTVTWSPELTEDGKFNYNTVYTATITLKPTANYTVEGVKKNFFKADGASSTSYEAGGDIVAAKFVKTGKAPITVSAVELTAPAGGVKPAAKITATEQFTGTVTWEPALPDSGKFNYNTVYTATITLKPTANYTVEGVKKNFFKVDGASSTSYEAGGDIVAAKFVKTGKAPITVSSIELTAPVGGVKPAAKITATEQFTGTVTWEPALPDSGKFDYNTAYTATIILKPTSLYTVEGVKASFFKVAGAAKTTYAAGGDTVTATFAKTGKAPITIKDIPLAAPMTGEKAVTKIETEQYTGKITWLPELPKDGKFVYDYAYTATITLTPKTGFTLDGVKANFFKVSGATATNAANGSVVTAVFKPTK
jgi:hypothetical protein